MFALHQLDEALEVVGGVVGAGRGFGVILDGDDGESLVPQAFDAVVVEVDVRDFDFGREAVGADATVLTINKL